MYQNNQWMPVVIASVVCVLSGCHFAEKNVNETPEVSNTPICADDSCNDPAESSSEYLQKVSLELEVPADDDVCQSHSVALASAAPRSVGDESPKDYWDISLAEVISMALDNGEVLGDLGGRLMTSPESIQTVFDPAIRESDPLYGVEGALSAFDSQLAGSVLYSKNDRNVNNITLGGGTRGIEQSTANTTIQLQKTTATGTNFALRNITVFDASNQPGNLFSSAWDTQYEIEARQPLLQGAGVEFNRIAGPNARPGFNFSSGVLIARINTDISLAEFETGVGEFTSQIEEAYWDLYFAYRNLDAWKLARDAARKTWEDIQAQKGLPGGTAEREARARVQYFIFEDRVQEALNGNPRSGSSVGVYRGERRLRLLMGLAGNDGRLLRPFDKPVQAKVEYDWNGTLNEAISRRPEIRKQKWVIKRDTLQLKAAKNFKKPRLDLVALGRARGFGNDLTGSSTSAARDVRSGDHTEWQVGAELSMPLGFRQAHAGIRQAELQLMKDRAILRKQELYVAHELGDAISEVNRAHLSIKTNYNRLIAAKQRLTAAEAVYKVDKVSIDLVLDAQQELSQSMTQYFDAVTSYEIAKKNVNLQTGALLSHHGIFLSEGAWSNQANADAGELRYRLREVPDQWTGNYPGFISGGVQRQDAPNLEIPALPIQESIETPNQQKLPVPPTPVKPLPMETSTTIPDNYFDNP